MRINKEVISKLNPCQDRFSNYVTSYGDGDYSLKEFIGLDSITYNDKVWVVVRLFSKDQNVHWSLLCAKSVLKNFEVLCPDDKRPRLALEATAEYLKNPSDETRAAAYSAAYSADSAADSADSAADSARAAARSAYSAYSAADSAADSAAYSARAAAYSARAAAYSADSAARSARAAAYLARAAAYSAEKQQENHNLQMMLEVL